MDPNRQNWPKTGNKGQHMRAMIPVLNVQCPHGYDMPLPCWQVAILARFFLWIPCPHPRACLNPRDILLAKYVQWFPVRFRWKFQCNSRFYPTDVGWNLFSITKNFDLWIYNKFKAHNDIFSSVKMIADTTYLRNETETEWYSIHSWILKY